MTNLRRALISLVALSLLTCGTGFMKALADDTGETDRSLTEIHVDADSSSLNTADMDAEAAAERQNMRAVEQNRGLEHFKIANYYTSRWDFRMAEIEFELAIMYYPTMKIAHRDYCLVSFARGQFLRSIAELLLVLGLGEPIPLNDTERAALKDRAAKIHSREGIADGRKGQWDMAIAEFKYALDNAPIMRPSNGL
jgi:tetratricopeptide (TPR) repeat protein